MGTGYTRADVSNNIADGNIINSSDLDNEYDAIEAAFNSSTGHTHDGTSAEGGPITVVGPVQDLVVSTTEVKPKTTNTLDIGTGSLQFKDLHLDGTAYLDDVQAVGAVDITGDLDVDNINIDGNTIISTDTNGDINISPDGTGTVVIDTDLDVDNININGNTISSTDTNGNITLAPDGTGVVALSSTDLTFGDNDKAIFGAGSDLQIYHDGSNSIIRDGGTGSLRLQANGPYTEIMNGGATETMARFNNNSSVDLYYDNSPKLNTTATGVNVTGTITSDGLTVDGILEVSSTNSRIRLFETDTTDLNTQLQTTGGDFYLSTLRDDASLATSRIKVDHATGDISFYDNTGVTQGLFWDASTQRLGLGTTSPSAKAHIQTASSGSSVASSGDELFVEGSGDAGITVGAGNTSKASLFFGDDGDNAAGRIRYDHSDNSMQFGTNGQAERARIDSSGNLLVGTTATSTEAEGFRYRNDLSAIASVSDGGVAAYFGRLTSDGEIVRFRQDSTTVGSIGVYGTRLYAGTGDVGLWFNDQSDYIGPINASTATLRDAAVDIGNGSYRFKDLYLSGGVYLGGTGSANLLDDYEEGTWTPALGGTWTSNPTSLVGNYTKIGRIVTVYLQFNGGTKTGTGTGYFTGLPFTTTSQGTGAVIDSNLNDKGSSLAANTDRIWVSGTSFTGANHTVLTYYT